MVFSVALAGLFPLLVILSRDLQPLEIQAADGSVTYDCRTPARDGATAGMNLAYAQHTWYLTPFDQPWARKLGAGVRIASDNGAFTSASPVPTDLPILTHDDGQIGSDSDGDGLIDYTQTGNWTLGATGSLIPDRAGYQYCPSLPEGQTPGYAFWNFTVPAAGWYVAEATWPAPAGLTLSSGALFDVSLNGGLPVEIAVNQQNAPNGEQDTVGTWWQKLGLPMYIAADSCVTVSLHAAPSDQTTYVVADGVRLVGVENYLTINGPVVRSLNGVNGNSNNQDVTVQVSVTVNLPPSP